MLLKFAVLLMSSILPLVVLASGPTAYVINTSGETLSKINLTDGTVTNNVAILGSDIDSYPNQILIKDSLAYVLNSGTDEIQVINLNTEQTVQWISFSAGSNPYGMDFYGDNYIYVTLLLDDAVAKVDLTAGQVTGTVAVGKAPEGMIILGDYAYIAVTAYNFSTYSWGQGKIVVYDCSGDTVVATINTHTNPQYLDFDRDGRLHVACTGDYFMTPGMMYLIDSESNIAVDSVAVGGTPGQVAITPGNMVYVSAGGWAADGEIYKYAAATGQIYYDADNPLNVDSGAFGMRAFQDSAVFIGTFADRVFRVDNQDVQTAVYLLGDGPVDVAFNYMAGDANGDWQADVGDAVYLINFVFKGGNGPRWPSWRADAGGDGAVNVGDAVYLINFVFKGGQAPRGGPRWLRW